MQRTRHERLVQELASLSEQERRAVFEAAAALAQNGKPQPDAARLRRRWASLRALSGTVNLGGNAVEDCDRLYDG